MSIVIVTDANYKQEVEESKLPVVIDIYATWCPPCLQMSPIFDELAKEMSDSYKFVKINVDDARDLSIKLGASRVPTFIFMNNNEVKGKTEGYTNKDDFKAKIKEFLG